MKNLLKVLMTMKSKAYLGYVQYALPLRFKFQQHALKRKVERRGHIKVCFLAMNLGMWRYQRVYEFFAADYRFEVVIVLSPSIQFEKEEQVENIKELRRFFSSRGIQYIDWNESHDCSSADLRHDINPDIIFYPQQYSSALYEKHSFTGFWDKLLCLCPYGIANEEEDWTYNLDFHNRAWKLFYTNKAELEAAQRLALNKGRNVVITGYTNMTEYLSPESKDVWKIKNHDVTRLIWAPHYTILEGEKLHLSNFLWMAEDMVKIAEQNTDCLQIAFKPHPKLRTCLYQHPDWGQERTDEYYRLWDEMPNTQLETGEFINLFKTSDAMVHDSDSFQVEYLYVNKPVMFVKQKDEQQNTTELCKRAIGCHYIGRNMDDIKRFVEMVLNDGDTMREQRQQFFENYLLPENGTDVALNIYNDIVKTLKL